MPSNVSTLLLWLMIYRSVVYRNGIGVMNIQLAEEYKNAEKGEQEHGFLGSRSRGSREEGVRTGTQERKESRSRGLREKGVGAGGPNSEDGVGVRGPNSEMESQPGLVTEKKESEPGA